MWWGNTRWLHWIITVSLAASPRSLIWRVKLQSNRRQKGKVESKLSAVDQAKKPKHGSNAAKILVETYWDSPEAKKLFLGDSNDERDVVEEVLEQRIERLQQANKTIDGWRDIIDKHDKDNLCFPYDVFIIRQRCSILCLAYIYALEEMNSASWIEDCCAQAIFDSNKMGIEAAATY